MASSMRWCFVLLAFLLCSCAVSGEYALRSLRQTAYGWEGELSLSSPAPYGREVQYLRLSVWYETAARLRVALRDANASRWEVPAQFLHIDSTRPPTSSPSSPLYAFAVAKTAAGDFGFTVTRASTGAVLFDSRAGPLHFSAQYIELSTAQPADARLYGFGERIVPLALPRGEELVIWNTDWANPDLKNLYGHHPVYQRLEADGQAHGVVLYNSNMMDGLLGAGSFRYRVIGGIIDLYFLLGPTPLDVSEQYTAIVGRPFMPPRWSVGWHQCRCFYESANRTLAVVQNYTAFDMPLDVIWNDIDWMRDYVFGSYNDELGSGGYTLRDVRALNEYVAARQQKRVLIVDPNIPALLEDKDGKAYLPYVEGVAQGIFVRHPMNDSLLYGKQWPDASVAWPDFTHPGIVDWWEAQFTRLGALAGQMDGVWLDMNEPSAFCPGQITAGCQGITNDTTRVVDPRARPHPPGSSPSDIPYPPFQPGSQWQRMEDHSFNISSHHYLGQHYNVKEFWGYTEQRAAAEVMERIHKQRAFTLSRSTFMGSGSHGAHWLGDNASTWKDLVDSIAEVLAMSIVGVVNVGADICGFGGETTEEMCARWIQLGSLYPFARSHNAGRRDQEPYMFGEVVNSVNRNSLRLRYSLLPYLYQLFVGAHLTGAPVWRPMFYHFPADTQTWAIDRQFMLGPALLGLPVVDEGAVSVTGYLPRGEWFDFLTFARVVRPSNGSLTLSAPLSPNATMPLLHRGGHVVARQQPRAQTADTWKTPLTLHVALDAAGTSDGDFTFDDGVSIGSLERGDFHRIELRASFNTTAIPSSPEDSPCAAAVSGSLMQRVVRPPGCTYNVSAMFTERVALLGLDVQSARDLGKAELRVDGRVVSLSTATWSAVNGALLLDASDLDLLPLDRPWTLTFTPSEPHCDRRATSAEKIVSGD